MNTRHIQTTRAWFGGGADLNPIVPDEADTRAFHARLEQACAQFDPSYYPRFKAWADEYFHLPHRNEQRGVGGIFYDYLEDDLERDFAFTRAVGEAFLDDLSAAGGAAHGPRLELRQNALISWSGAAATSSSTCCTIAAPSSASGPAATPRRS